MLPKVESRRLQPEGFESTHNPFCVPFSMLPSQLLISATPLHIGLLKCCTLNAKLLGRKQPRASYPFVVTLAWEWCVIMYSGNKLTSISKKVIKQIWIGAWLPGFHTCHSIELIVQILRKRVLYDDDVSALIQV